MSHEKAARCFTVCAKKKGETIYVKAPDGSFLHSDGASLYPLMASLLGMGWKKVVSEELEKRGDHYLVMFVCTMTPPRKPTSSP